MTGTTLGQIIPFLILPVLTRLYSEADFGILTAYTATSLLFARIASFKYEFAIVLEKEREAAANLVFLGLLLTLCTTLVVAIGVVILKPLLDAWGWNEIGNYLYLVPLTVLGVGGYEVLNYWFNRQGSFKTMAGSKLVQSGAAESIKVIGGMQNWASGLVVGRVVGEMVALVYMLSFYAKTLLADLQYASRARMWELARKHSDFLKYSAPSAFLGSTMINFLYANLFVVYFGREVLGNIGLATAYVSVALGIISRSFAQVFYKEISEIHDRETLLKVYRKHLIRLSGVSVLLIAGAYLFPSKWVVLALGDQWTDLMDYLRIVIVWIGISFVSSSLSFIYIRLQRQRIMMFFDGLHLALVSFGIVGGHAWFGEVVPTLWCFTVAQSVYYILAVGLAFYFINRYRPESE